MGLQEAAQRSSARQLFGHDGFELLPSFACLIFYATSPLAIRRQYNASLGVAGYSALLLHVYSYALVDPSQILIPYQ